MQATGLAVLCVLVLMNERGMAQGADLDISAPLSVEDCIRIARQNAPVMGKAQYDLKAAQANVLGAWAAMLPSFSTSVTGYKTTYGPRDVTIVDPTTGRIISQTAATEKFDNYSSQISYGMSLFDKGLWSNLSRQQANEQISVNSAEVTEQDLVYRVKEAYFGLLALQRLLHVNEETLRSTEENIRKSESMFEVGSASKADVLKQKVQVQNARASLIQARNDVDYAQANLANVMGLALDTPVEIIDVLDIAESEVNLDESLRFAREWHPNLLMAEAQLDAAKAGVGYAKSAYWPSLGAGGSYSWGPDDDLSHIGDMFNKNYNWNLGLQLRFNIPDFSTVANIRNAKALQLSAEQQLIETQSSVSLAVRKAHMDLKAAKEMITAREEGVASAAEDLKLAEERYRLGASTALELIDAQLNHTSAQTNHVRALYDYKLALAQLEKAMGRKIE